MTDFPQIQPIDASPEIAKVFTDIRFVSGLAVVNLIWRHFAALPGVIDWAWPAVRPIIASQQMIAARQRLMESIDLPLLEPVTLDAWRTIGLSDTDLADFRELITNYVRGNCTNLIALTALRLRLEGAEGSSPVFIPADPPPIAASLPPLPRIDYLEPELAHAIQALAKRHEGAQSGIVPSLYLELARWPILIKYFPLWLAPLYAPLTIQATREATYHVAQTEAMAMLPTLPTSLDNMQAMRPALDQFTRLIIPDLIPVCLAVQRLLPDTVGNSDG